MTADTVGGVWSYAVELAAGLGICGVEVALVTMGKSLDREQRTHISGLKNIELFEGSYKLEWMNDPWEEVDLAGEWIGSIAQLISPDLVHLNGYAHGALGWNIPVLMVAHSCVYSWFRSVKGHQPPPSQWGEYKKRIAEGIRGADFLVAPSQYMLNELSDIYSVSFIGKVISNGRSRHRFVPRVKDPFILTAGRLWDEGKNIKALSSVAHRLPWHVLAAGERMEEGEKIGVYWLGKCSEFELASWMGAASIYALPARYEPFGLSVLEAALCESALVLGDIPSLREIWGESALYVDPDNNEELVDTLQSLIHKPWLRREYAEMARQRALEYSVSKMTLSYLQLYKELIEWKKGASSEGKKGVMCA